MRSCSSRLALCSVEEVILEYLLRLCEDHSRLFPLVQWHLRHTRPRGSHMPMANGMTEITKGGQVVQVIAPTLRTQLDVVNLKLTVERVWRIATEPAVIAVA